MAEFDRVEHNRRVGKIGGQSRSERKLAALRTNAARARAAKAYYRQHPNERPQRQPLPEEEVSDAAPVGQHDGF